MNKTIKSVLAICLSLILCMSCALAEGGALKKNETVYVLTDTEGNTDRVIVSDRIANPAGAETIADRSCLSGIEVLKGNAVFTAGEDGSLTWDTAGGDLCYRGDSDAELPLTLKVSYTLDGTPVSAAELAGRSGRLTIRFDYIVNAGDPEAETPFLAVTGFLADPAHFSGITVKNGAVLEDGDRCAVVGIAIPGLSGLTEGTGLPGIPDRVEVTADVTDFEMGMTLTLVTCGLPGEGADGADPIRTVTELLTGLDSDLAQLSDGLTQLSDGAAALKDGADTLSEGVGTLTSGLDELSGNSAALRTGAEQVFLSLLATANEQLADAGLTIPELTIEGYADVIDQTIAAYSDENVTAMAHQQVEAAVRAEEETIRAAVTDAVRTGVEEKVAEAFRENVLAQVLEAQSIPAEGYDTLPDMAKKMIDAAVDEQLGSDQVAAMRAAQTEEQMAGEEVTALIAEQTESKVQELIEENMASEEVLTQIGQAAAAREALTGLKAQLDSYDTFYEGLNAYTGGVDAAASGADELNGKLPELVGGIGQIADGIGQVVTGLSESGLSGIDLAGISARLETAAGNARAYNNFSGLAEGMEGNVRFIYRTEEIR